MKRLTEVRVGDVVALLPDGRAPKDHSDAKFNPNSTLELGPAPYTVGWVEARNGLVLIGVKGSFKLLDMRRFTLVERSYTQPGWEG